MKSVKEKILAGDYVNKLPFIPATINLNLFLNYENEEQRLEKQFKKDLIDEFKPEKSISDLLFYIAYQEGHNRGYMEIYNKFIEILHYDKNELQKLA